MLPSWLAPEVTLAFGECGGELAELAARYGIRSAAAPDADGWQIVRSAGRISIRSPRSAGSLHLTLDGNSGALRQRLRTARPTDALPRACGLAKRAAPPHVLDATAGLGRDALVLAQLGCRVDAWERVPALALLLHLTAKACGLQARLQVHLGDAVAALASADAAAAADVVYLDPMFDEPGKAQVKKDMQVCRLLAGPPDDVLPLFEAARRHARERVVVKRHHGAPQLADGVAFAVAGERIRFDVYLREQPTAR